MKRFFLSYILNSFIYKYINVVGVIVLHESEEDKLAHMYTFIKIHTADQSLQDL